MTICITTVNKVLLLNALLFIVCIYVQYLPTIEGDTTCVIGGPMLRISLNYCSCSRLCCVNLVEGTELVDGR